MAQNMIYSLALIDAIAAKGSTQEVGGRTSRATYLHGGASQTRKDRVRDEVIFADAPCLDVALDAPHIDGELRV